MAELKASAEAGNVKAQEQLGETYFGRLDFSSAAEWFHRAASQQNMHSFWRLGQIYLHGKPQIAAGSKAVPAQTDLAIQYWLQAANAGHSQPQIDLGKCYAEGTGVKQDLIEAYKWIKLGTRRDSLAEKLQLDPLILKLSQKQIAEGEQRVQGFREVALSKESDPVYNLLVLQGLSGTPQRRFAMVNNYTFAAGEEAVLKLGNRSVRVRIVTIRDNSVVIRIDDAVTKELVLKSQ